MKRNLMAVLAISAAVLIVYRDVRFAYFFEDDFQWLAGTLTYDPASLFDFLGAGRSHVYRPILELYFWGATPLFGGSPTLFHLANVALHVANGVLLYLLACTLSGNWRFALITALLFVVLPGYVDAVAWVGALGEPVGAFFGVSSILAFLAYKRSGRLRDRVLSVGAFAFALLTHESSVVFLPLLVLADWAADEPSRETGEGRRALIPRSRAGWAEALRTFAPYVVVAGLYAIPDLTVTRRSYMVSEGHYRLGFHAVRSALDYVVWLYVGKRNLLSYAVIVAAISSILVLGTRRARFAICWMFVALLPFLFFTWGNTSRYLYLPAMGFAILLAEGIAWLDRFMMRWPGTRWRLVVTNLVVAALVIRFAIFASKTVRAFSNATQPYRAYGADIRATHPTLPNGAVLTIEPALDEKLKQRYLEGLVQWEYRNPTLRVRVRGQ
jgi:hypothetical protein